MKIKIWIICLSALCVSCLSNVDDIYKGGKEEEKIDKEDFFNFTTTQANQLIIDYGMKMPTVFSLYDEYPLELIDNTWELKKIAPIYSSITDEDGKFSSKVVFPAYLKEVWLVSENVLVASPIKLELNAEGLIFNYNNYKAKLATKAHSRAVIDGITYPDGYDRLGNWDANGIPDYLMPQNETQNIPNAFLKRCNSLIETTIYSMLLEKFPEYRAKESETNDMVITKPTGLVATYFAISSTSWEDMVAYYTYKKGESIDIATVKKTILIPRSSKNMPESLIGRQIKLKYWNPETETYEDEFPEGTHIGWVLLGQGFGLNSPQVTRYSNPEYNKDRQQRSILLSDPELDNYFFMCMEDNTDMRFNDVQFAITSDVASSIEPTPSIPPFVSKDETSYAIKGSLAFEDNWPYQGDYDMNDVVIYYSSTMVTSISGYNKGNLVRTTTTFTPVNNGATFTNGFGIQLDDVKRKDISSITVSSEGNTISSEFASEYEKPVVILFSDIKYVLNKPITVAIEYAPFVANNEKVQPPYNPFIFVNTPSREVHLSGYLPTNRADNSLRGKGSDLKIDDNGNVMYYISKDNMPFAIHLANQQFIWSPETTPINQFYPSFESWRKSKGTTDNDWYLHPVK